VCWLTVASTALHPAPAYIAESLQLSSPTDGRCRLRSTDAMNLLVPVTHCRTLSDRSFPVAAARAWYTARAACSSVLITITRLLSKCLLIQFPSQNALRVAAAVTVPSFYVYHLFDAEGPYMSHHSYWRMTFYTNYSTHHHWLFDTSKSTWKIVHQLASHYQNQPYISASSRIKLVGIQSFKYTWPINKSEMTVS